ncbi:MAG: Mrp/NBP35 family ATP-binding protein, partial [Rikenellaceae bacterium]|nr:Mrp/NBP35 family ATP-binding protein [Rikenellaceae bacterium]
MSEEKILSKWDGVRYPEAERGLARVRTIVAIASGKGGVGKSSVAALVAATLAEQGYRVGVLDADVYGPSQPQLFGVEGYLPPAVAKGGVEWIVPAESMGVRVMSIGFFVAASNAMVWRGPMAGNALRQMIHQTL